MGAHGGPSVQPQRNGRPIFENIFAEHSYGLVLKAGRVWVVDADLKAYFDTIPQEPLMRLVEEQIADSRVVELIGRC